MFENIKYCKLKTKTHAKLLKDNKAKIKRPVVGYDPAKKANVKRAGSNLHTEL